MSVKLGAVVLLFIGLFLGKVSFDSIESAEAQERYLASHPEAN